MASFSVMKIAPRVISAIYDGYVRERDDPERGYLGMSVIGDECWRRLWYGFRFVVEPEVFDGRKLRLFATGHREEERMIADLRRAGMAVDEIDPDTGEQWLVVAVGGHAGGHMDGKVRNVPGAEKVEHVIEAKTHKGTSFNALVKSGVKASKPVHYAQMQTYMHLIGLTRTLYIAHDKDTDELHAERVDYDMEYALRMLAKADTIINAQTPPPKLHKDPTTKMGVKDCKVCKMRGPCHDDAWARRNCRTCLHSTPMMDGEARWTCARFNHDLTIDEQRAGCGAHLYIPALVPGKQVDADDQGEWVEYVLRSGETWRDGAEAAP